MTIDSQTRGPFRQLISLLEEIDQRWASEEWNLGSSADIAGAHRTAMHILEAGLVGVFEQDVRAPDFRRIVTPSRKLTGDNSDAIYFDAPVSGDYEYLVEGTVEGAAYFSLTIEEDSADGNMPTRTGGVINDEKIDVDENGRFRIYLGGEARDRNWLPLGKAASRITSRHYFENAEPAAKDPFCEPRMRIQCLNAKDIPAPPSEQSVSEGIERVINFVRSRTLGQEPMMNRQQPGFVSLQPNVFPQPQPPGDFGLSAFDAHYSMAPYFIAEDEALVISARWPDCRFANVNLWNRFQQTYDYVNRNATLNRVQTVTDDEQRFEVVLSHQKPNHPNWLDTEGAPFGMVFWRYFLVQGEVECPVARVVKLSEL